MSNKKQYVGMPSANMPSQTANTLSRFADNNTRENMFLNRKNQIRDIAENRIAAKKSKSSLKQKKAKAPTMDDLATMVQNYNDYVYAFDLNDQTINYEDYFNKDDPSFIDNNESLGEELMYVQNRIWKLQGDKRYVPDYSDTETMTDQEFNDFIGLAEKSDSNTSKVKPNKIDRMSDKKFTELLDAQ